MCVMNCALKRIFAKVDNPNAAEAPVVKLHTAWRQLKRTLADPKAASALVNQHSLRRQGAVRVGDCFIVL